MTSCASVVRLLFWGGPANVARFVVPVRIWPAVESFSWRSRSYTGKYVNEEVIEDKPAFVNSSTLATVIFEIGVVFIVATLEHTLPC